MSGRQAPLERAYAWQFIVVCALFATVLALLAAFAVPPQVPVTGPRQATFSVAGLADPTPPASKPEEPTLHPPQAPPPKPTPKRTIERAAAPVAAPVAPAPAEPIRAVAPNPQLAPAVAAPSPAGSQYGATLRGELVVDDMRVPLPDGQWRVAADIRGPSSHDIALARETDKLIAAVVIASYNTGGNGVGYNAAAACSRRGLRGLTEKNEDFGEQSCWSSALVRSKGTVENISKSAVGRAARGDLEGRGLTLTSEAVLDTVIVLANANRRMVVAVFHNPEADGFEPIKLERLEDSPWHAKNLAQNPRQAKWLREHLQWASQAYQRLKQGFNAVAN